MERESSFRSKKEDYIKALRQGRRDAQIRDKRSSIAESLTLQAREMKIEGGDQSAELLAKIEAWAHEPVSISQLDDYILELLSDDLMHLHHGIICLRNLLLQHSSDLIQMVIDSAALPRIIALAAQQQQLSLQLEASWALSSLLSGSTAQTGALVRHDIIPLLLELTHSAHPTIVENGVWALGNVAADCADFRAKVLAADSEGWLLRLHAQRLPRVARVLLWIFSSFCRLRPRQEPLKPLEPYIRVLVDALVRCGPDDADLELDCLLGLQPCARSAVLGLFLRQDLFQRLHEVYRRAAAADADPELLSTLHQIFGALSSGPDEFNELLLRAGMLGEFARQLLNSPHRDRQKEVCWVLSNVGLGPEGHVQALAAEPGLLDRVFLLTADADPDLSKEALWVVCNLCKATNPAHVRLLLDKGLLALFLNTFAEGETTKLILALDAIGELLEAATGREGRNGPFAKDLLEAGVVAAVEKCQFMKEDTIYQKAKSILENHFELED